MRIPAVMEQSQIMRLNIGGAKHQILINKVLKYPDTLLYGIAQRNPADQTGEWDSYDSESQEYFFDRNSTFSDSLLRFYREGRLHFPEKTDCSSPLLEELEFWKIDPGYVAPCCVHKIKSDITCDSTSSELQATTSATPPCKNLGTGILCNGEKKGSSTDETNAELLPKTNISDYNVIKRLYARSRAYWWLTLEEPMSSKAAMVLMAVSCCFILLTIIALVMGSLSAYKFKDPVTNITTEIQEIEIADTVCVAWFSLEWVARFWSTPHRFQYAKSPMSIIDILSILPFYVELTFSLIGLSDAALAKFQKSMVLIRILRILRVLRVLRVLKVARYSKGFQSMGSTIRKSWRELIMMVMFMITTNIMFSTALYFIEGDLPESKFTSIPAASWWCIITMTTVGYGDITPTTTLGKLTASVASITGILLLAFPISVVVQNFDEEYYERQDDEVDDNDKIQTESNQMNTLSPPDIVIEKSPRKRTGGLYGQYELKSVKRRTQ